MLHVSCMLLQFMESWGVALGGYPFFADPWSATDLCRNGCKTCEARPV